MVNIRTRLLEAADYLDDVSTHARWHPDDSAREDRWRVDVAGPIATTQWLGPKLDVLTATWPQAALVDMCSPFFVRVLATWMRTEAKHNFGDEDHSHCEVTTCSAVAALALAELVLKEKEKET
jgi:hypothetical protein